MVLMSSNITQAELKEHLHYNPDTGVFTKLSTNEPVGSLNNLKGYSAIRIKLLGNKYLAHRLAYIYMTGTAPKVIDHINGKPTDNRWCNLRAVTINQNQYNSKRRCDNTSGYKGVNWHSGKGKWVARLSFKGKRISVGSYITAEEANIALEAKRKELHGQFANNG